MPFEVGGALRPWRPAPALGQSTASADMRNAGPAWGDHVRGCLESSASGVDVWGDVGEGTLSSKLGLSCTCNCGALKMFRYIVLEVAETLTPSLSKILLLAVCSISMLLMV